jgi:hypothetical protein
MTVILRIQISANNLRAPVALGAEVRIEVKRVQMTLKDIKNLQMSSESE